MSPIFNAEAFLYAETFFEMSNLAVNKNDFFKSIDLKKAEKVVPYYPACKNCAYSKTN